MIYLKSVKKFCKDDISLIENYDKAIADKTQTWQCHHRRETIYSAKELIQIGEYYNRPACELIFLTKSDHNKVHHLGKHTSEETKKKMHEAKKGKHRSEETRLKISAALKGKSLLKETCKKMSEARKGTHWYNNGVTNILAKTCPEGFVKGMLTQHAKAGLVTSLSAS